MEQAVLWGLALTRNDNHYLGDRRPPVSHLLFGVKAAFVLSCLFELLVQLAQPSFADSWVSLMKAGEEAKKSGNFAQAKMYYSSALKIAETFGEQDPRLTATLRELGDAYLKGHELAKAETTYRRELKILGTIGENYSDVVHDYYSLGQVYAGRGNYQEADKFYRKALAVVEKNRNATSKELYYLLYEMACNCRRLGRYDEAESYFDRMLVARREINHDNPESFEDLEAIGGNYFDEEKYQEAKRSYLLALSLAKSNGAKSARVALLLGRLAEILIHEGKFDEAKRMSLQLHDVAARYRGPTIGLTARLVEVGFHLHDAGHSADAEPLFKLALDHPPDASLNPKERGEALCRLGTIYQTSNRFSEAASCYEKAAHQYRQISGPVSVELSHCLSWLGMVRTLQKQPKQAESLFRQALAMALKLPQPHDLEVAGVLRCLAGTMLMEKNYPASEAFYRRALSIYEESGDPDLKAKTLLEIAAVLRFENRTALADQLAAQANAIRANPHEQRLPTNPTLTESEGKH